MLDLSAREIENLIDLVEIKMMAMREGAFLDESELTALKKCRSKLFRIADRVPGVTVIPFDGALVS